VSLRKQGANKGATTAFLISTPESGIDSIAVTYALMDPLMTVARPIAGFVIAAIAGISENLFAARRKTETASPDLSCPVDGCCDGLDCPPDDHTQHHGVMEKFKSGIHYALAELWGDLAGWFFIGLLLAGLITVLVPDEMISHYLGGGVHSMLIMLAIGIPLYICATASTPIAAALMLKGLSPGAALVFLIAGPATNIISLTVLFGVLGKRATAIYLLSIAVMSVVCGLALDQIYLAFHISAKAAAGQAGELMPFSVEIAAVIFLLLFSIKPVLQRIKKRFKTVMSFRSQTPKHDKPETKPPEPLTCAGSD
jgi:uncharacterized protein